MKLSNPDLNSTNHVLALNMTPEHGGEFYKAAKTWYNLPDEKKEENSTFSGNDNYCQTSMKNNKPNPNPVATFGTLSWSPTSSTVRFVLVSVNN